MTRRAVLCSKSNTGAGEIQIKQACQKVGKIDQKNEDISRSVNSFDTGTIFPARWDQDLSRDVVVVSVYAFQKKFCGSIGSGMTPKNDTKSRNVTK